MKLSALLLGLVASLQAADRPLLKLENAFPRLKFEHPVLLTHAGDGSGRVFVVEQAGQVRAFPGKQDADQATLFLDISPKVRYEGGEEGLLSLAFHPKFRSNHKFYAIYSLAGADPRRTVLSRFETFMNDPSRADPATEKVILQVEKLYSNHNGATLAFGPDGYLYVSLGDGGSGGDPHGNGQNLKSLLGKVLRIDVDHPSDSKEYGIPPDNPFLTNKNAAPEVWAYGLRNVWRMSFDATGKLWAGDVGQNKWEEIDVLRKGGNYGWNIREGKHPFRGEAGGKKLVEPMLDYGRSEGVCVTGGHVYNGKRAKSLKGQYVFGDFGTSRIWAFPSGQSKPALIQVAKSPQSIASFGVDQDNELYVVGYDGSIFWFQ